MIVRKIALIAVLLIVLIMPTTLLGVVHDYGSGVKSQNAGESPSTSSSGVNNYINQDEQINLDINSGSVKVLRTDQKINLNDFVTELVQFKNANPRELRHAFRVITGKEGGNADVLQDKVGKEYYLQVVCPEFQLPYLKAAAQALDVPWIKVGDEGDLNVYYKAKFRPVQDIWWISQFYRSWEGYFEFDTTNNALYFNDQPACKGLQEWGLKQIDIPPNQVLLEISVYEVNTQNDMKIGLDFMDWKNGPGRNLFEGIFSSLHFKNRWKYVMGGSVDSGITRGDNDFRYFNLQAMATTEFIDFLLVKGKAREMTKTTLLAQSGHLASTEAIDQVVAITADHPHQDDEEIERDPYVNRYGVSDLPQYHERYVNFVQNGQVGVYVEVLPFVGQESMELSIMTGASSVTGIDANGLPIIGYRELETHVRLVDGEPFVVGGLKRSSSIKRTAKVPFFGSIPVLGWIFGNETNINRENDVLIVIKPKFILGTESDMEIPEDAQTIIALAKGEEKLEIPKNKWGFDQWLLDEDR